MSRIKIINSIKSYIIPSLVGLGIISSSINVVADSIKNPSDLNYSVEVKVPSKINIPFYLEDTVYETSFSVDNLSLLPITLNNVKVAESEYWKIVGTEQYIKKDTRELSVVMQGRDLKRGDNELNEYVDYESSKDISLKVIKGIWTKAIKEEAITFGFDYEIHNRDFDLIFDSNGGENVNKVTSLNGSTVKIPDVKRVGYTFVCWEDDNGKTYQIGDDFVMPVGGAKLTAKWDPNKDTKYVVNHYQMNLDGSTYTLESTDKKTGVTDFKLTTSDLTKTYKGFTYKESKVDSIVVKETTIKPDGSLVIDLYYSRNKYLLNFSGWLDGVYSGSLSNAKATYGSADVYVDGKLVASGIYDYYTEHYYGSSYEIKNVQEKPGRRFNGFKLGNYNNQTWVESTGKISELGNQILLDFSTIDYSISYNLNGGTNPSTGVVTNYDIDTTTFDLPIPTRTGYTFGGWYEDEDFTKSSVSSIPKGSTGDKTYYAKWDIVTYNLTYDLAGGTATNPSTYNVETETFTLNNPTRTGYTFAGWTGSNGSSPSTKVSISKGSTGNKSYTANWKANKYNVVFNGNGSTSGTMNNQTHTYDSYLSLTTNTFTRKGYTFTGWNTKSDGTGTPYTDGQSVKNLVSSSGGSITLYAQWSLNTYKITYNLNGGSNPSTGVTTTYNVNSSTITLPTPTRTGYTFGGWFESSDFSGSSVTQIASGSVGNKSYYAKWNVITYSITYNLDGGLVLNGNPSSYTVETNTFTLNVPTKLGYSFAGWTGTGLSSANTSVTIAKGSTGNRSYTATWTPNKYVLTFNANGGTVTESSREVSYGFPYGTLPTPSRVGYTFRGWFTSASGGTEVTSSTMMTSTVGATIFAQWTANTNTKYTVRHYQMGLDGSTYALESTESKTGTSDSSLTTADFVKTYTGFTYSNSKVNGSVVTTTTISPDGSRVIDLYYSRNKYTLDVDGYIDGSTNSSASSYFTFDIYINGTLYKQSVGDFCEELYYGMPYEVKNVVAKNGRTYNGFKTGSFTTSTGDKYGRPNPGTVSNTYNKIYIDISTNTYTITYNLNGGTNPSTGIVTSYNVDTATFNLPKPTRTGYTFGGWYDNSSLSGTAVSSIAKGSTGNKTLYAKWTPITYTISYNANGGSGTTASSSHTYDVAKTLTSNGFSRTGYTFLGWSTNSGATSASYSNGQSVSNLSTSNGSTITLYAVWKANSYTYNIKYVSSSGKYLGSSTVNGTFNTSQTVSAPSKTGYTTPGSQTVNFDSTSVKTITFTYPLVNYTIGYTLNGGSASNPSSYNIESSAITLTNPTRTGYQFSGWTGSNGTTASTSVSIASGSTGNKTYTANWKSNSYTIAFNSNGGSGSMSNLSMTYDTAKSLTSNSFTRTGYTFAGWATSSTGSVVYSNGATVNNLTASNGGTVTLYAKWTPINYTIAFNGNGHTGGTMSKLTMTYDTSKTLTSNAFSKTGYSFAGWATSSTGAVVYANGASVNNLTSTAGATVTLYAKWNVVNYSITYNLNGGTNSSSNPSRYNITSSSITLANPTRTGYNFDGWYTESTFTNKVTQIASGSTGNKTFYAKWTPINYSITYNLAGGSLANANPSTYNIETSTFTLNVPTKLGYAFAGWTGTGLSSATTSVSIAKGSTGNRSYTATWTANKYTLTFNANGGSVSESTRTVAYGSPYGTLPTPTRTGYTFNGWFTSASGGTQVSSSTMMTSTAGVTIYAQWTVNSYTATFNGNGGSNGTSITKSYGSQLGTLPTSSRTGYQFKGWYTATSGGTQVTTTTTMPASNVTYYAQWTANTYTVTYNANGGSGSMSNSSHTYGVAKTLTSNAFSRTGYTFAGWATSSTGSVVYSNGQSVSNLTSTNGSTVTLYAKWTPITYTVSYNGNGSTGGSTASSSHTYDTARALTNNGFTKTGYSFAGWAKSSSGSVAYSNGQSVTNLSSTAGSTVTLYAKWNLVTYTINYNLNGGSNSSSNPSSYNITSASITLANPTRTGYTFGGWYSDSSFNTKVTSIASGSTGNKTLYAKWTANSYTIKFNANGGSGTMSNLAMTYGTSKNLTSNSFTKPGYTFQGWATSSSGSVAYLNGASVNNLTTTNGGSITLYAVWKANTYTIAYNGNGSTSGSTASSSHTYGIAKTLTANGFSKTGHNFAGWATSSTGAVAYSNSQSVTNLTSTNGATVTLYAKWNPWTHTVAYNANGGSGAPGNQTKTYGVGMNISSTVPTRTGYTFAGWNTKSDGSGTNYSAGGAYTPDQNGGTVTLYAKWTANSYTINFNANGGSTSTTSKSVTYGSTYGTLPTPTRTGYTFKGWFTATSGGTKITSTSSVSITSAQTLYAQWTANTYTIKFNANGGSGSMSDLSMTYGTAKNLTTNSFIKTGYTFLGWSTSSTATTATYTNGQSVNNLTSTSGGSVTLYAVWKLNSYTITYNLNGGTNSSSNPASYTITSSTITLANPTRTGYTFGGWYSDSSFTTSSNSIASGSTGNKTFYAKWTANSYTIKFNSNGGSGSMSNLSMTYGTSTALTSNKFSRTGYTFAGWSTSSTASTATYTNGQSVSNLTSTAGGTVNLYAVWKANSYTIKFNANGGSGTMSDLSMTYGTAKNLTSNAFTRSGYTFLGWSTSSTASSARYSNGASVNNLTSTNGGTVTLYAVWQSSVGNGTVTFNFNGGGYYPYNDLTDTLSLAMSAGFVDANGSYDMDGFFNINHNTEYYSDVTVGLKLVDLSPGLYFMEGPKDIINEKYQMTTSKFFLYDSGPNLDALYNTPRQLFNYWSNSGVAFNIEDEGYSDLSFMQNFSLIDGFTPAYKLHQCGTSNKTMSVSGGKYTYPFEGVVKEGYKFVGWFTSASGGTQVDLKSISGNTTVYAQWSPLDGTEYSLTSDFSVEDGNSENQEILEYKKNTLINTYGYERLSEWSDIYSLFNLSDLYSNSSKDSANPNSTEDKFTTDYSDIDSVTDTPAIKEEEEDNLVVEDNNGSEGGDPPEKDDSILDNVTFDEQVMVDGEIVISDEVESNIDYSEKNYEELFGNGESNDVNYYKEESRVTDEVMTEDDLSDLYDSNIVGDDVLDLYEDPSQD